MNLRGRFSTILFKTIDFRQFFRENDIFVCDRGFRNSRVLVIQNRMMFFSPCLETGHRQQTTEQANETRRVTKIRYVIKVVNDHLKCKFKGFFNMISNELAPENSKEFRIIAAIHNRYGTRVYSDRVLEQALIDGFIRRLPKQNLPKTVYEAGQLDSGFEEASDLERFPENSKSQLVRIAFGTFQVSMAISYYFDTTKNRRFSVKQLRRNLSYREFHIQVTTPWLIRA